MKLLKEIAPYIICFILCILLLKQCRDKEELKGYKDMYEQADDSLHKTRNQLNQEITSTKLLIGDISTLKSLALSQDSSLKKLQKIVNKNTLAATILSTTTTHTLQGTTNIVYKDTIIRGDTIIVFPQYSKKFVNKWEDFDIVAGKDSIKVKYKVFNEFEIKQEWKKDKWYKEKYAVVEVKNVNPNTETKELKSFIYKQPKKNKVAPFITGVAIGALSILILK